jgi:hypothetical protein
MVDSVNGVSISALLRAQTANIQNTRPPSQAVIINHAPQKSAVTLVKAGGVTQPGKTPGPSTNLPRGSLVDKLV